MGMSMYMLLVATCVELNIREDRGADLDRLSFVKVSQVILIVAHHNA
jgi:hypothetical protein